MKYLSDIMQEGQTKILNDHGAFFAFGKSQFEEKRVDGVIYCDMGYGLVAPKDRAKSLDDALSTHAQNSRKLHYDEYGAERIIRQQYFNMETQINGDLDFLVCDLAPYREISETEFSEENIRKVAVECYRDAVKNDWF
jgi:hypothetical protein